MENKSIKNPIHEQNSYNLRNINELKPINMPFELPNLDYSYDALEPHIDKRVYTDT